MTRHRRPGRYPVEFRERAVRMVFEAERHCGSQWAEDASRMVSFLERLAAGGDR